jgi:hypothetical protein
MTQIENRRAKGDERGNRLLRRGEEVVRRRFQVEAAKELVGQGCYIPQHLIQYMLCKM